MSQIPPLDYGFLLLESKQNPNHIGPVEIMRPPAGAPADYVKRFAAKLRKRKPCSPFNYKIKVNLPNLVSFIPGVPSGSVAIPQWRVTSSIDMEKHVLYHVLPRPGTKEQLLELLQSLHEPMLKRDRPLWECHVIEGYENGQRFVVYTKVHHAIMDGMMGTTLFYRNTATTPGPEAGKAFWELPEGWSEPEVSKKAFGTVRDLFKSLVDSGTLTKDTYMSVLHSGLGALRKNKTEKHKATRPFTAEPTSLDIKPDVGRSIIFGRVPLAQVKALSKACGVSVNDLLLTALDVAVGRFLADAGNKLKKRLVALMPLALRTEVSDTSESNSVVILPVKLGRKDDTFPERLRSIAKEALAQKDARDDSSDNAMASSMVMVGLAYIGESLNLTGNIAPLGNFVFSNVMGPKEARYRFDAKVEEIYPVSMLSAGVGLNITSYSYAGQVHFQFIAMKKAAPDLNPLMEHLRFTLLEFEQVVAKALADEKTVKKKTTPAQKKTAGKKKAATKKTTTTKKTAADKKVTTTKRKTTTKKKTTTEQKATTEKKTAAARKATAAKKKSEP